MDNTLEKLKTKAFYHNFFEDGSWDVFIGFGYIFIAFAFYLISIMGLGFQAYVIFPVFMYLNYKVYHFYKLAITYPRIGKVSVNTETVYGPGKNINFYIGYIFLFSFNILNLYHLKPAQDMIIYIIAGLGIVTGILMFWGGWKKSDNYLMASLAVGTISLLVESFFIVWSMLAFVFILLPVTFVILIILNQRWLKKTKETIPFDQDTSPDYVFVSMGVTTLIFFTLSLFMPEQILSGFKELCRHNMIVIVFAGLTLMYGLSYRVRRITLYGFLLIYISWMTNYLGVLESHYGQFVLSGLIVLLISIVRTSKFMKKYPLLESDNNLDRGNGKIVKKLEKFFEFDDGITDIYAGGMLLGFISSELINGWYGFMLILVPLMFGADKLRRTFIYPRLGSGRLRYDQIIKVRIISGVVIMCTFLAICNFAFQNQQVSTQSYTAKMILIMVVSLGMSIFGLMNKLPRFRFYGITALGMFVIASLLKLGNPSHLVILGLMGITMIIRGSYVLKAFLKEYPVEEDHE